MRCSRCRAENRQGRRFCAKCGAPLAPVCPSCGFSNEPDDEFCGGCGVSLHTATGHSRVTNGSTARPSTVKQDPLAGDAGHGSSTSSGIKILRRKEGTS